MHYRADSIGYSVRGTRTNQTDNNKVYSWIEQVTLGDLVNNYLLLNFIFETKRQLTNGHSGHVHEGYVSSSHNGSRPMWLSRCFNSELDDPPAILRPSDDWPIDTPHMRTRVL